MEREIAGLSLDLDNLWAYLKAKNDPQWKKFPSYFDKFLPIFSKKIKDKITVFVVGQDAVLPHCQEAIKEIANQGHEIGNHSFHHEPWLGSYDETRIRKELQEAEEAIQSCTGSMISGFRGPGFSWSPAMINILYERGYDYDSSVLPTFIGPLARLWFRRNAAKTEQRLFGNMNDGFMPVTPFSWKQGLLELPVTTIPYIKFPFHMSYLHYLWSFSPAVARSYFKTSLRLCRATGTPPNFLLHPTDFLGKDQVPELSFFPGMKIASDEKERIFDWVLNELKKTYAIVPLKVLAETYEN